jgi:hypothetical protein
MILHVLTGMFLVYCLLRFLVFLFTGKDHLLPRRWWRR